MAAKKNVLAGLCVVVMLGLCVLAGAAKGETKSKNVAADAYKLRMQGKVDDAKAILEQAIQANPHNAAAYYELARTNFYMVTHPQQGVDRIAEAQQSIEKAIENDPNNVIYPFFEGHIALFQYYMSQTKENAARLCGAFEIRTETQAGLSSGDALPC